MNPTGYSGKSLIQKLGFQVGDTIIGKNIPGNIKSYFSDEGCIITDQLPATWLHGFFMSQDELRQFVDTVDLSTIGKGLWFSWPKRASNVPTDLTEQTFRDILLPMGWVDTKVAAIDQTWSGLKFLRRRV